MDRSCSFFFSFVVSRFQDWLESTVGVEAGVSVEMEAAAGEEGGTTTGEVGLTLEAGEVGPREEEEEGF